MRTLVNVSEVFDTIQGEAFFTGTPSWFIRLQGCDVGCPFCDTKYTWAFGHDPDTEDSLESSKTRLAQLMARLTKGDVYKADPTIKGLRIRVDHLVLLLREMKPGIRHFVLTGGEPMAQPHAITALCTDITLAGCQAQIETSGTYPIDLARSIAWVTVSPKIDMPSGRIVLPDSLARADEIKFPVGKQSDVEKLNALLAGMAKPPKHSSIWLQPLSQGKAATDLCVQTCQEKGWRLSLQTHKFIGLA